MYKQIQILIVLLYPHENGMVVKGGSSQPPEPHVDPPLFQKHSLENRVLGIRLPMRNAGLQSNIF